MNTPAHKYWKTRDRYLAAYLFARGGTIVGIEANAGRAVFTFIDSLNRQNRHDEYRSGKALIDARVYVCALEILRQRSIDALMQAHGSD